MTAAVIYAGATVPLCREHADAVRDHLDVVLGHRQPDIIRRDITREGRRVDPGRPSIVYYGLSGNHIKIGSTTAPSGRWRTLARLYGEFQILVVEPGGAALETKRHAEFVALRVRQTEMFSYEGTLRQHVADLQLQHPDWRAYAEAAHAAFKAADPAKRRRGNLLIP